MKTLKKTLCLVLAMVMVFGLCVTSASAKLGYADTDDITHKEAVDVLSGIGILSGDARGFRPKDDITRAEAAKIMAYIMIGNATQADALKATSDPFVDVPISHWASGYIAYCASSGIILGMSDGYHPNDNVTGLQFATMLLRALGYGKQSEYVGSDWSVYAARDALRLGIFNGNLAGASATKDATREECALYAFNTIAGANDNADGTKSGIKKVSYSTLLGNYIENTMGAVNPDANKKATFGEDFGLKCEIADNDAFGRIAGHYWTQKIGNNTKIISDDYDDDQRLIAVYTTAVTSGDIYNLIVNRFGKSFLTDVRGEGKSPADGEFEFYLNSEYLYETDSGKNYNTAPSAGTNEVEVDPANFEKGETKTLQYTGNGVQTYVYAWTDSDDIDHLRICMIDTYLAKVEKVVEAKGGRDPETTVVLVESNEANIPADLEYTVATEDFDEGDYVLVTVAASKTGKATSTILANLDEGDDLGTVVDIEAAPTLETEVTKYIKKGTSKSLVANGETYVTAKNTAGNMANNTVYDQGVDTAAEVDNKIVDGDDHVLYLDKYGYLIATSEIAEVSNYAYVAQFGKKTNDATTLNDENALRAHVYFADGTDGIYTVDQKAGIFDDNIVWDASFPDGEELKQDNITYATNKEAWIGVYKVSVDKNKVTLVERYNDADDADGLSADVDNTTVGSITYVTKGNANIFGAESDSKAIANGSTVFFYVYSDYGEKDFKVTVYNGINSVPTVKKDDAAKAMIHNYIMNSKKIIKAAYVIDAITDKESSDIVYFFGGTDDTANFDKSKDGWTVRYYVYGGDDNGYLSIKYESAKKADEDIAAHPNAGFVKVEDGKLSYVAEDQSGGTCSHSPAHKKADDVNKVTYTTEATLSLVSGDRRDTLKVTYTDKNGVQTYTTDIYMPLYKVEENGYVFDLRDADKQSATKGEVDSLKDLFTALINGDVTNFKAAVSIEGTEAGTETNVLTGIYILGQTDVVVGGGGG